MTDDLHETAPEHGMSVSATGGLRKNIGKLRLDLVPPSWVRALALVLGKGAAKYADRNWEKGLAFTTALACAERHLLAFKQGEDLDPETGEPHTAHVAVNALFLLEFQRRIENNTLPASLDDRPQDWRDAVPNPPIPDSAFAYSTCRDCITPRVCSLSGARCAL